MGAGEKVASDNKRGGKYGNQCDFSSTPLKQGTNNRQWLADSKKNFSGRDLILVIVSLMTYVLDTVTGKQTSKPVLSCQVQPVCVFNQGRK